MNENVLVPFAILLLISMVFLTGLGFKLQTSNHGGSKDSTVSASGIIYIRADGSIYPPGAPISTIDNIVYVFTGSIGDSSIVVERDNIAVDGSGFMLQGPRGYAGISLTNRTSVTIKNLQISGFNDGIILDHSSNNIISENNITDNVDAGIDARNSPNNIFSGNNLINNMNCGVEIRELSNNNSIIGNKISNSTNGIYVAYSLGNTISGNNLISGTDFGILLQACQSNSLVTNTISNSGRGIYTSYCSHNNIIGNTILKSLGGIWLGSWSRDNTLRENSMSGNYYNFGVNPYHMDIKFWVHDVDASNTANGKPIYYWIDKHNMTVPSDAGQVTLVNCTWITVQNLTLTNNWQGIQLASTTDSAMTNNNIADNWDGIKIHIRSSNNNITGNTILNNVAGVWLGYSSNNRVFLNEMTNNRRDVGIYGDTERGGIVLRDAKNHDIFENDIVNNVFGIEHIYSSNNNIYHNNIIGNTQQVYSPNANTSWANNWDTGYPSGGNYWTDHAGVDIYNGFYQNETGSDGIRDERYIIDAHNIDNDPLTGRFSDFNIDSANHVQTICNSTISDLQFNAGSIRFNVSGENGTSGFCRISIPTALVNGTYKVFINGTKIPYTLLTCSNSTHSYLYFAYNHSTQEVIVISEFTFHSTVPIFIMTTLFAAATYRRKHIDRSRYSAKVAIDRSRAKVD